MDYTGYLDDHIGLCVFDLDGTLVDSLADLALSVNWILSDCGFPPIDSAYVRQSVGNGARNLLARSFAEAARRDGTMRRDGTVRRGSTERGASTASSATTASGGESAPPSAGFIDAALARYRMHYTEHCMDHTVLYPGIREWLEFLHARGRKMAVLTNKPSASTDRILGALGVADFFGIVAGPETFGVLKPDPAGLVGIMERFGMPAEKTVMVGDSAVDIRTGRNAGVLTCGITGGLGDEIELRAEKPDILIERR